MTAEPHDKPAPPTSGALPLERRAGLARETLRLIRDMSDSLVDQAHEARRRCRATGDPQPMATQIEALVAQAERLRRQGDQLTRAFAVLDRLVPPAPPAGSRRPAAALRAGAGGRQGGRGRGPAGDETRGAAFAFAHALRLEGASREHVEARLVEEFGRSDARAIADEAFGASPG